MTLRERRAYRAGYLKAIKESKKRRFYEDDEEEDWDNLGYDNPSDDEITDYDPNYWDDGHESFDWADPENWESWKTPEELKAKGYTLEDPKRDIWVKRDKKGRKIRYWRGHKTGSIAHWHRDIDDELNGDDGSLSYETTGINLDQDYEDGATYPNSKMHHVKTGNPISNRDRIEKWEKDWEDPELQFGPKSKWGDYGRQSYSGDNMPEITDQDDRTPEEIKVDNQAIADKKAHNTKIDSIIDALDPEESGDVYFEDKNIHAVYNYAKNYAHKHKIDVEVKGGIEDMYEAASDKVKDLGLDYESYGADTPEELGEAIVVGSTMIDDLREDNDYLHESRSRRKFRRF